MIIQFLVCMAALSPLLAYSDARVPGEYVSIPRSSGERTNAKIRSRSGTQVTVEWEEKGVLKEKELSQNFLSPPLLKKRVISASPGKHDVLQSYVLEAGDQILHVDRLGRDSDIQRVVAVKDLPAPPWDKGHCVSFVRSSGERMNGEITKISKEDAEVSWIESGKTYTKTLNMSDLSDPRVIPINRTCITGPECKFQLQVGDSQAILNNVGRSVNKTCSVAELIYDTSSSASKSKECIDKDVESMPIAPLSKAMSSISEFAKRESKGLPYMDELLKSSKSQFPLTLELLRITDFQPKLKIQKDGLNFYISAPMLDGDRLMAIMYVAGKDGKVYPRIIYKSNSDGDWRSAPAVDSSGHFWKGNYLDPNAESHYTQETKVVPEISIRLMEYALTHEPKLSTHKPQSYFVSRRLIDEGIYTYDKEFRFYSDPNGTHNLHIFQKYQPGRSLRELSQMEKAVKENNPAFIPRTAVGNSIDLKRFFSYAVNPSSMGEDQFVPDFEKQTPIAQYETNHSLLSDGLSLDVTVRVYRAKLEDRDIQWHIANDRMGRVWIDRICFSGAKVNTYGLIEEGINSGGLTNKPLEYESQVTDPNKKYVRKFNDTYQDFSPLLDHLLPIQMYRKKWGILRRGL